MAAIPFTTQTQCGSDLPRALGWWEASLVRSNLDAWLAPALALVTVIPPRASRRQDIEQHFLEHPDHAQLPSA